MRRPTRGRLLKSLAILMLAAGIPACGGGGDGGDAPPPPTTGTFRFINSSGVTVERLYLWPASDGLFPQGKDQLGINVLADGATFDVTDVPCETPMHYRATTAPGGDGSYLYWTDVNNTSPRSTSCGGTFTWTLTGSQSTGTLTVFITVDNGGGPVVLSVDGSPVYTFTNYFTTGFPDCGAAPDGATYTAFVSPGDHTIFASNSNATWGPDIANVPAGGCLRFRLF